MYSKGNLHQPFQPIATSIYVPRTRSETYTQPAMRRVCDAGLTVGYAIVNFECNPRLVLRWHYLTELAGWLAM